MSTWITIEPEGFIKSHRQPTVANEQFFRSPFDVPDAIRLTETPDGEVVIQLRYLGADEPTERVTLNDVVTVEAGKRSRRLFSIHVKTTSNMTDVTRFLAEATVQIRRMADKLATENSDAAAEVIESSRPRLLRVLKLSSLAVG